MQIYIHIHLYKLFKYFSDIVNEFILMQSGCMGLSFFEYQPRPRNVTTAHTAIGSHIQTVSWRLRSKRTTRRRPVCNSFARNAIGLKVAQSAKPFRPRRKMMVQVPWSARQGQLPNPSMSSEGWLHKQST